MRTLLDLRRMGYGGVAKMKNYEPIEHQHMAHSYRRSDWFWLTLAVVVIIL